MTRKPLDLVVPRRQAADAFGLVYGQPFSAGAWLVTEHGEIRLMPDGQVETRPTPLPWSRPSWSAIPTITRSTPRTA